jgi:hypothetical protein
VAAGAPWEGKGGSEGPHLLLPRTQLTLLLLPCADESQLAAHTVPRKRGGGGGKKTGRTDHYTWLQPDGGYFKAPHCNSR